MPAIIKVTGNTGGYKKRVLSFIGTFEDAVFLDSNDDAKVTVPVTGIRYSYIAAAGITDSTHPGATDLEQLQAFIDKHREKGNWIFGFVTYDVKNLIEDLVSSGTDQIGFPLFHFFVARHVIIAQDDSITILSGENSELIWQRIVNFPIRDDDSNEQDPITISHIPERDNYLQAIEKLQQHIQHGDIYEVNYCHEIKAIAKGMDPLKVFRKLTSVSPNPFSCYYRSEGRHLLCASPERFMAKREGTLLSQPIKGTAARDNNPGEDSMNLEMLAQSEKERSENIMIVDLVRNDLSKIAERGSVRVDELCGVYTFARAHQMISTISCRLLQGVKFTGIIEALFPMGSMTGAPKISAMKIIEENEDFKRSLFSGSVGYINPEGDFDFNVVIRSILYNENNGHISIAAGSAITAASDSENEYHETLVKLAPQVEALGIKDKKLLNQLFNDRHA